jgi:hypothetical protein
MTVYREVKFFDLGDAPEFIRDAIRPVALMHISTVDATSIWEITVGTYDWQDAAEEWALHRWLRESGATEGEFVLVKLESG